MTKHRHAEMIKAKADNMELVVFYKDCYYPEQGWKETSQLPMQEEFKYFLCLPQHKEACLHWLNGGETQMHADNRYFDIEMRESTPRWSARRIFMNDRANTRIKPKKEKLYIAVKTDKHEHLGGCRKVRICSHAFVSKEDAESYLDLSDSQLVEIEVDQ